MQYKTLAPLPLVFCAACHGTGVSGWKRCRICRGGTVGLERRSKLLYWDYPLEEYHLTLENYRHTFNKIRWVTVLLIALNFFVWAAVIAYAPLVNSFSGWQVDFGAVPPASALLVWFGLGTLSYLVYRSIRERAQPTMVEPYDFSLKESAAPIFTAWESLPPTLAKHKINIARTVTTEARQALAESFLLAGKNAFNDVTPAHLFFVLLSNNRISNIFIRLGVPAELIKKELEPLFHKDTTTTGGVHTAPRVSPEVFQSIFLAYEEAYQARQEYVGVIELFIAVVGLTTTLQELLFDIGIDTRKLTNVVAWARTRERLFRRYTHTRQMARYRSKHGMDRAMTALATPYLDKFSQDLTGLAKYDQLEPCVARDTEIEEIFQIIAGGVKRLILVGDFGVGKRTIVEGIAQDMVEETVPEGLRDKRLVRLSIPELLAGTTPAGVIERLQGILFETSRARNVILFIHNIHELFGISAGNEQGSLDVAGSLVEFIEQNDILTIATTTTQAYGHLVNNSKLGTVFTKVEIKEMTEDQAIQTLETKVGNVEYKQEVFFAYEAIEKAVVLAEKFLHEQAQPGNAIEIIHEVASLVRNKKGAHTLVTGEDVARIVAEKTHIPVTTVTQDESTKLINLETAMHERVVGQDEAVRLVASALRRARAEMRSTKRPIANFLFLGPTGVGKTELAKTIADVYFGGEKRMIRLDMSEYQDKSGIYRLIGQSGQQGTGVLTEAVRHTPFTLLLLDEIEKADPDILNLFLQVMDDGRLTDSVGRVVDFTNVILVATSNAGTSYVQEQLGAGISSEAIKERLLHGELKQYFRPEFLNRFDGIVLFKALDKNAIKQIAALMLKGVAKDLEAKGVDLVVTDEALEYLAGVGFDPDFGARPMRRVLQERVENQLADLVLAGKLKRRDVVEVGAEGVVRVR